MQKELLSAYMDGEEVSAELTKQLCQDKDSQESWAAYHTVRSVMRKESPVLLGADFTAKMADLIELEEVKHVEITVSQPTPEEADSLPFVQKLKAFFAPMTQIAVAAGVCLVAVVVYNHLMRKTPRLHLKTQFYKPCHLTVLFKK